MISIHASEKEATFAQNIIGCFHFDFNPRLREGGDSLSLEHGCRTKISIHASEKEATVFMAIGNITKQFQSTPPRRRRPGVNLDFFKKINFNPRLREGGDCRRSFLTVSANYFNPRLREGGDVMIVGTYAISTDFNPRLREGGDAGVCIFLRWCFYFNPRLREGGDDFQTVIHSNFLRISIHASEKEATT